MQCLGENPGNFNVIKNNNEVKDEFKVLKKEKENSTRYLTSQIQFIFLKFSVTSLET